MSKNYKPMKRETDPKVVEALWVYLQMPEKERKIVLNNLDKWFVHFRRAKKSSGLSIHVLKGTIIKNGYAHLP